ncbi:hypothetical protein N7449_005219 [Penicillium cf. viridicatum]|uniref:YWTD domain-containing protein n=1 Tax=Penicillium cf. viridicatum TaxID=2972119 RepID=A0A9W9ML08_9EURO|nr:hypothetical protein N7449_005219 [Penicillium cf. viridicatum]
MVESPLAAARTGRLYLLDVGLSTYPEHNGRILTYQSDGSHIQELITNIRSLPDGIAIDTGHQHIYWTNMGVPADNDGSIQRCDLSGNNVVTIIPKGQTYTPKQMTIAPKSKKLYWSDREGMRVMRANMDGSHIEVLYQAGTTDTDRQDAQNWCVGIAVDEESKSVFWTQKGPSKGNKGRIFRMDLDTKDAYIQLLLDNLPEPIDLELDHASGTLYWTDRGDPPHGNSVNSVALADVSANNLQPKVLVRKLHEGIGLALDLKNNRMFFGDLGGSLYSANLDGSCKHTIIPDIGGAVTGVAYVGE